MDAALEQALQADALFWLAESVEHSPGRQAGRVCDEYLEQDTVPKSIRPVRVNHLNLVVENFDASVAHLEKLYGAEFLKDLPQVACHAGLVDIGRVLFELFEPAVYLLNARYGPHYLGIEYQADMETVRAVIAEQKIRIVRDIGIALHTHPADCYGVSFEFYDGFFHDDEKFFAPKTMKKPDYWLKEHPLGLTGLKGYTVAVSHLGEAVGFFQRFLNGDPTYEAARPAVSARAVGLQVGDAILELVAPVRDGVLQQHLNAHGQGIRSTVFGVRDIDEARRYFRDRGIELIPGDAPGAFAIPPHLNLGLMFEFSE